MDFFSFSHFSKINEDHLHHYFELKKKKKQKLNLRLFLNILGLFNVIDTRKVIENKPKRVSFEFVHVLEITSFFFLYIDENGLKKFKVSLS